ncbi:MAG: hypothetical protein WD847_19000 [Pirellulales bacterium]
MRTSLTIMAVLASLGGVGCTPVADQGATTSSVEEYEAQLEAYKRQTEQTDRLLTAQELQTERAHEFNDRYEKILAKWEEQALRMDAVLEAEEKRTGIRP